MFGCFAAHAQYRFDHWTEENGLPHNWIKGIWQTRDGYLWLTTGQGVARFDGARFKVFNRANTPALSSDRFSLYAICEDRQQNLWLGTEDGGVIRYHDGVFTTLSSAQGLPGDNVLRVDEDAEGAIWIFTSNGLARWRDGQLTRVAPQPNSPFNDSLVAPRNVGAAAKYFGLWRRDSVGWQRFAYGKWEPFPLPPEIKDPARLQINSIVEDARRRIWYTLRDRPEEYYRIENGQLATFHGFPGTQSVYYQDRQERVWLTDQSGRTSLAENGRLTPLIDLSTPDSDQVLEDREGTLWIASLSHGLYRLKREIVTVYLHPGGAQYNNIQPLMQDRAGNIWLGSGGLARFRDGNFENFYHEGLSHSPAFERNVLISLFEDYDGSFWLGVRDGIVRFINGRLERDDELSSQIRGWVHAIYRDRSGALWFGSEEGLYCLRDGKLARYGKQDGLISEHIRVIHEDRSGTLWFGTVGGLVRHNQAGFYSFGEADRISPSRISAIYEDKNGVLWVGTYDGLLYRVITNSGKPQVVRYGPQQGLPADTIHIILEDDRGFFWIGGERGIYRLHKQELEDLAAGKPSFITATTLGKNDGLRTPSCNSWGQPAGFKAPDGRLWFPTEEGIAVIDPNKLPFNSTPPPVLIEECLVDHQPVAAGSGLRLSPSQQDLEINYTALSFIKPEQMRFKYKLEGLDRDWVAAGTRRTAYYSHLPPGDYSFVVLGANSDGVWNETGQRLPIKVLPPFYRTWWFTLTCAALMGLIFFVAYRARVSQLERAQQAQEDFSRRLINAHETERSRLAGELHDSIVQSLAMIKNRAVLGAQATEGNTAKEQLELISEQTAQTISEVREISYNLRPYLLDRFGLTKAIGSLVNKIGETPELEVASQIDDVDNLFPSEAEMSVYRIIQEGLNNVLKHSEATEARVSIEKKDRQLAIIIQDNGKGFDVNAPRQSADASKGGFGLLGMSERIRMLGGTRVIESEIGAGTRIIVDLPLRENHRKTDER